MKCNYTKQIRNAVSLCAVGVMSLALFGEAQTASADTYIVAPMADTYLQSDGTQAIDTGYYANESTKVIIDFEPNETNVAQYVFGAAGNGLPLGLSQSATSFTLQMIGHRNFNPIPKPEKVRYRAIFDCTTASATIAKHLATPFEETFSFSLDSPIDSVTNDISLAVFSRHTTGYASLFSGKLYSMQIYDGETLVRDFIPYGFGATTGLYDRVNGKVYGNALTSGNPFVIGHGDAYVRGSEIDSAYVNTGVTPTPTTKVEIDFAMMSATANSRVFGNLGGSAFCMDLHVDKDGSGNFFYSMQDGRTGGFTTSVGVDVDRHVFALSTNEVLLASADGTVTNFIATSFPNRTYAKTAQGPMVVFGASNSANPVSGSQFPCDVKVYRMKIWEDGVIVRDFTPFMKNGAAGFLDNCDPDANSNFHGTINANPLGYGGAMESDADPIPAFTVNPQSGEIPVEGSVTLSAYAPAALGAPREASGYQWFLGDDMIEGATGSTLVVNWTKDTRLVRKYKCIAFFEVFGYAESTEAVLTNAPAATVIIMK